MQFVGFDVYVLGREASGFECGENSRADVSEWQVSHLNHFHSHSHSIIGYSLLYIYISLPALGSKNIFPLLDLPILTNWVPSSFLVLIGKYLDAICFRHNSITFPTFSSADWLIVILLLDVQQSSHTREQSDYCPVLVWYWFSEGWGWVSC